MPKRRVKKTAKSGKGSKKGGGSVSKKAVEGVSAGADGGRDGDASLASVYDVNELERMVRKSKRNANGILRLLGGCEGGLERDSSAEVPQACVLSLVRVFRTYAQDEDLLAHAHAHLGAGHKRRRKLEESAEGGDKLGVFLAWLGTQYGRFCDLLGSLVRVGDLSLQIPAVDALVQLMRLEAAYGDRLFAVRESVEGAFPSVLVRTLIAAVLETAPEDGPAVITHLTEEHLGHDDLRYHALGVLREHAEQATGHLGHHISLLLAVAPLMPDSDADLSELLVAALAGQGAGAGAGEGSTAALAAARLAAVRGSKRKRKRGNDGEEEGEGPTRKCQRARHHRKGFERACLAICGNKGLGVGQYKRLLGALRDQILPNVQNPLMLMDFLSESFDVGGVVSVMALDGLFFLMRHHNLDYPSFFAKIYSLLQPTIFSVRHRDRFFTLLDTFLRSRFLPTYLVMAFVKRLGRLALSAPPQGAMIAAALMHKLMIKHPTSIRLIHNPDAAPSSMQPLALPSIKGIPTTVVSDTTAEPNADTAGPGDDPFDMDCLDPAECGANDSSLWEIQALQHHYAPSVARTAKLFTTLDPPGTSAKKKRKHKATPLAPIKELAQLSYAQLVHTEATHRSKKKKGGLASVPVAFELVSTLFDDSALGAQPSLSATTATTTATTASTATTAASTTDGE